MSAGAAARKDLGWAPKYDFSRVLEQARDGESVLSSLAGEIGVKGYHDEIFADGPYPVTD